MGISGRKSKDKLAFALIGGTQIDFEEMIMGGRGKKQSQLNKIVNGFAGKRKAAYGLMKIIGQFLTFMASGKIISGKGGLDDAKAMYELRKEISLKFKSVDFECSTNADSVDKNVKVILDMLYNVAYRTGWIDQDTMAPQRGSISNNSSQTSALSVTEERGDWGVCDSL